MTSAPEKTKFITDLERAWQMRQMFHDCPMLEAYRIFHGYTEGLAGVSIDRYGEHAIVNKKIDLPLTDHELAECISDLYPFAAIVVKSHQRVDEKSGDRVKYLRGGVSELPLCVREDNRRLYFDPDSLHTNGLYLDARPARRWLTENSRDKRVLNLFAHTGSLGVSAKLGGATEVIHLDKSRAVVDKIRFNYHFNDLRPDDRGLLHGDLYFHLPRAIKWGQKFSGIILDPPPRVPPPPKAPKHRPRGQDFEALIALCCELMEPGGWLMCLYHDYFFDHEAHDRTIMQASQERLVPFWRESADQDFPETDPNRVTRMTAFRFM